MLIYNELDTRTVQSDKAESADLDAASRENAPDDLDIDVYADLTDI